MKTLGFVINRRYAHVYAQQHEDQRSAVAAFDLITHSWFAADGWKRIGRHISRPVFADAIEPLILSTATDGPSHGKKGRLYVTSITA